MRTRQASNQTAHQFMRAAKAASESAASCRDKLELAMAQRGKYKSSIILGRKNQGEYMKGGHIIKRWDGHTLGTIEKLGAPAD